MRAALDPWAPRSRRQCSQHGVYTNQRALLGNGSYSADVDRRHQGVPALDRLSALFTRDTARPDVPHPPDVIATADMSEHEKAFNEAVTSIRERPRARGGVSQDRHPEAVTTTLFLTAMPLSPTILNR